MLFLETPRIVTKIIIYLDEGAVVRSTPHHLTQNGHTVRVLQPPLFTDLSSIELQTLAFDLAHLLEKYLQHALAADVTSGIAGISGKMHMKE